MTAAASFSAVGLATADLTAALAFYARLGIAVPQVGPETPHVEVELPGGLRLMFDPDSTVRTVDPSWSPGTGPGRITLAFQCPDPAAVDALHAELLTVGGANHLEPFDAPWGQRYAAVSDPDGNAVDLFAAL